MKTVSMYVLPLLAVLLFATPAYANAPNGDETYCQHEDLAGFLFDVAGGVLPFLDDGNIDLGTAMLPVKNILSGLREASKDKDGGVERYARELGRVGLSHIAGKYGWEKIWTYCDAAVPIITSVMYREVDGRVEGWLPRAAVYCRDAGYIADGNTETLLAGFWTLRFTPEEEDAGIAWLAEEIAAVRNMRRGGTD